MSQQPPKDVAALSALFMASGVVHLVKPEFYEPIMPRIVPRHREVIYASGVAELVCAAGMLHPRSRARAGWASLGLLVAVYPANVKMAMDLRRSRKTGLKAAAFARLPLQLPMIRAAYRAATGR